MRNHRLIRQRKTTLLGLCAGLDDATGGSVKLDGHALESMSQDERTALRNRLVGFVFQSFQLIPTLTAIENVLVPLELRGETGTALVLVTHDPALTAKARRVVTMGAGTIIAEEEHSSFSPTASPVR